MSLKKKLKEGLKRLTLLDDDDKAIKKDGEFRKIPYAVLSKKIIETMKNNKDEIGRVIIVPNHYVIYLSQKDRDSRKEVEALLIEELKEELFHHSQEFDPQKEKEDIGIEIRTDASLPVGNVKIDCYMKRDIAPAPKEEVAFANEDRTILEQQDVAEKMEAPEPGKTIIRPVETTELYQLIVIHDKNTETHRIKKANLTIGRGSKVDIRVLGTEFISREHAKLVYRDDELYLIPLGANGALKDGEKLPLNQEFQLKTGDQFQIEDFSFKVILKQIKKQ